MKKIIFLFIAGPLLWAGCGQSNRQTADERIRFAGPKLDLLFVGNSYTYVNDLPQMFVQLALSGHHLATAEMIAPGGWTLAQHANSKETLEKIAGKKWDDVILQDQSVEPSMEKSRAEEMFPAVRYLNYAVRQAGARPLLYLTWGRQKGLAEEGFKDFDSMQAQLTEGYMEIAKELNLSVVPVGEAWKAALAKDPGLNLWQGDGSHPTLEGTYLAACVFYASLYQKSPEGLEFPAGIPPAEARDLQTMAAQTVLTDRTRWNIP